jgi:hypothetical protein
VRLTVPQSLAGVAGPCPQCQTSIQAPYPAGYQPPQYQQPTQQQPYPQAPHPSPERPAGAQPTLVRVEPRALPNRSEPVEAPTRVRSDPSGDRPALGKYAPPPQRQHRSRMMRYLVPMTFLCLALGVIFGVKTFLQKDIQAKGGKQTTAVSQGGTTSAVATILPVEDDTFEALTEHDAEEVAAVDPLAVDGGIHALEILEKFLSMKTLSERMSHLESKLPEDVLAASVLNGPLPEVLKITVDVRETNAIEKVVDHYYQVDFADGENGVNPQTMLVRIRGSGEPKVVVDPFLDLFGGNFARYAEKPTEEAGTFQVIISAGAFCYDDVPSPEKKFTLKILAREDAKEIAKAYFGKFSTIGAMLEDETSGLTYAQAKPCTIFMRWNMDEDPAKPFLEALDIKALDWNP